MSSSRYSNLSRREFIRRSACAAVGTAVMTSAIRDLRHMNAAVAQSGPTGYKALVCVFLQGGNDSNNMIIPTITSQYNNYASIRTPVLAIPSASLLGVTSNNPDGNTYGLHPSCPELAALFGAGTLAFMFNTGTLVYPVTRTQYLTGTQQVPPQLFSHADQQTQWQTSIPNQPPTTGWGGRVGDLFYTTTPISMLITLAGANTFEVGNIVSQLSVSTSGAIALSMPGTPSGGASSNRLPALLKILGLPYTNMQSQAYAGVAAQAVNISSLLNNAIAPTASSTFWTTPFPTKILPPEKGATAFTSTLAPQLEMVARLIAAGSTPVANGGFGMTRQIFFVQVGGYDLHTGQTNYTASDTAGVLLGAHTNLLAELSQSLNAFQAAMVQLNLSKSVTAFTMSDFSRTFPSNGEGSDHGWGSHHLILGGDVIGGSTYGTFPELVVNGPNDTGTGRWIPTTATDQYFATLASWFGVSSTNIPTIFPNVGNFASSNLGFMNAT